MLTIGALAARTGVSRRMLRHWDEVGLLAPASVDEQTGYRWYAPSQAGRVLAIASLRAAGFGLDEITDLLATPLTEVRLVELLRAREGLLEAEMDLTRTRLTEVRRRLAAIDEGRRTTLDTIELAPMAPMRLACLRAHVDDEAEIGAVIEDLLAELRRVLTAHGAAGGETVITYFGPPGDAPIEICVGIEGTIDMPELVTVQVPGAEHAASVQYAGGAGGVGDAWILLDSVLLSRGLRTTGVYRQRIPVHGPWKLNAPTARVVNGDRI